MTCRSTHHACDHMLERDKKQREAIEKLLLTYRSMMLNVGMSEELFEQIPSVKAAREALK